MSWMKVFATDTSRSSGKAPSAINGELLVEPRQLLNAHKDWIKAMRLEGGYDAEKFDRLVGGALTSSAEWVHFLPANCNHNHSEPGGLLRLAVESAGLAFRRAEGKFLAEGDAGDLHDRARERALRYVVLLASLIRPIGHSLTQLRVTSSDARFVWNPWQEGLWSWRRRVDARSLTVQWLHREDAVVSDLAATWVAAKMIPPNCLTYLHQIDDDLVDILMKCIGGYSVGPLTEIVAQSYDAAITLDLKHRQHAPSAAVPSATVEERVINTLRSLCRDKWVVNSPGARLWYTESGVYLVWQAAVADIRARFRSEGIDGLPQDADVLAQMLVAAGHLSINDSRSDPYFRLQPHARGVPKNTLDVVRINDPSALGLALSGVIKVPAQFGIRNESSLSPAESPLPPAADPPQMDVSKLEMTNDTRTGSDCHSPADDASAQGAETRATDESPGDMRLKRLGTAGVFLQKLLAQQSSGRVTLLSTQQGVVVSYPDSLAAIDVDPQEFLASCEVQGLLVPTAIGRRSYVREAGPEEPCLPRRYVLLAPRMARYLKSDGGE